MQVSLMRTRFNPRSHVGSDCQFELSVSCAIVSIHAPTWGTTDTGARGALGVEVSIHAPTWGATDWSKFTAPWYKFQSTLPRGERPSYLRVATSPSGFQSTLPRGERRSAMLLTLKSVWFQSTLPRGERHNFGVEFDITKVFQSTLPRGERPIQLLHPRHHQPSFNPRSNVGSDLIFFLVGLQFTQVSIHAPTWGATSDTPEGLSVQPVSIHAPTWGATLPLQEFPCRLSCFNPRSHVGSDRLHG